jgi:hypothetical protein
MRRLRPRGGAATVAYVGPAELLETVAPTLRTPALDPHAIVLDGAAAARLREVDPHAVVVVGADPTAAELVGSLGVPTLGIVTSPAEDAAPGDLRAIAAAYDRLVAFDGRARDLAQRAGVLWRVIPPAVDDRWFSSVNGGARHGLFGATTERRERFVLPAKHVHDLMHVESGARGTTLRDLHETLAVGVHVHADDVPGFEHAAAVHLAAGHLLVSEMPDPLHGLEPGLDFLLVRSPEQLVAALAATRTAPDAYRRMRLRGRAKAESFRASRVWSRVLDAFWRDLAAFG